MRVRLKRISETFTKEEFERLKAVKGETGLSWHDFLLEMLEVFIRSRELGLPEFPPEKDEQLLKKIEELRSLQREKLKGGENE